MSNFEEVLVGCLLALLLVGALVLSAKAAIVLNGKIAGTVAFWTFVFLLVIVVSLFMGDLSPYRKR